MTRKRTKLAAGAGAALAAVGAGGAVAATKLSPAEESKAVVEEAARQLGVDPARLSAALTQALENRIDEAVQSGRLTERQGEALKARIEAGAFPLSTFGRRAGSYRGFRDLDAAAAYLGVGEGALRERLRQGETLAEIASAEGKRLDGLVTAIVVSTAKRLDAAVAAGRITDAQRDLIVASLKRRTTEIVDGTFPALRDRADRRSELPRSA